MRKVLLLFLMLAVFCLVSAGGCGGSSSGSSEDASPSPDDWNEMTGVWLPSEGTMTYYNTSGAVVEVCTLNLEMSTSVDVTITGASSLYNVRLSSGKIHFDYTSGTRNHESFERDYTDFNSTGGYKASGGRLTRSDNDDNGTLSKAIRYENDSSIKAVFRRKEGAKLRMKAEVTFNRIGD